MKWEAKKIDNNKWGVFLMQEFCKTDEPVCYSATTGPNAKKIAHSVANRLTNNHVDEE